MSELVTSTSSIASRSRVRSASSRRYEQPANRLKLGERSFSFAGPAARNSLPPSLHDITNHKTFGRELKTVLFKRAYNRILTFRFYVMRHWSRYGVNGALEMTFMNELSHALGVATVCP